MAKKKHTRRKRHHSPLSAKKHTRRRRRMGAGKVAGMLSNPVIGGIIGGLAGMAVQKFSKKANLPGGEMTGTAVPILVAFLIRKRYPAVAAGMAAGAGAAWIAPKIPFLNEGEFISANYVNADVLNADGETMAISEGELNEVLSEVLSDYGQIHNTQY